MIFPNSSWLGSSGTSKNHEFSQNTMILEVPEEPSHEEFGKVSEFVQQIVNFKGNLLRYEGGTCNSSFWAPAEGSHNFVRNSIHLTVP